MKYYVIPVFFLLTGCLGTAPVVPTFPEPPGKLAMEPCPELEQFKDEPTLSDITKTIVKNYGEYYTCAVKQDIWIEWYQMQKKIFEDLKK